MKIEVSLDLLGGINYPKRVIKIIKHVAVKFPDVRLNIGLLANASGWDENEYKSLTAKVIKEPNVCGIRLHGLWKDDHRFKDSDIPLAKEIGQEFNKISLTNRAVRCSYSPCLEHEMSSALLAKFVKGCTFGNLCYVNSYIKNGARLENGINETHHSLAPSKKGDNHSFDGLDQLDADMNKYKVLHKKAEDFYGWSWYCNQKCSKKDTTKRENRKLLPQLRMIDVMIYQALHTYPPEHKLDKGRIYKAFCEAHLDSKGQADSRSYSIVFLTTGRPKEITFRAKGKVLLKLEPTTTLHGEQKIYRNIFNPFAIDLWQDALKINGTGLVSVFEDGVKVGTVLPIFRCGDYRNIDL